MKLGMRSVFQTVGSQLPISYDIPCEQLEYVRGFQFTAPIHVEGVAENRANVVTLKLTVSCTLDVVCDRCLKPMTWHKTYDFVHTLVEELEDDKDEDVDVMSYLVLENGSIDIDEAVIDDLLLSLPTKILCREDCKGLCPICGCDLNETTCNCQNEEGGLNEDGCTKE